MKRPFEHSTRTDHIYAHLNLHIHYRSIGSIDHLQTMNRVHKRQDVIDVLFFLFYHVMVNADAVDTEFRLRVIRRLNRNGRYLNI